MDAVHTNAGKLGLLQNVGKTDFWMNGGFAQAGCFKFDTIKNALYAVCTIHSLLFTIYASDAFK